MFAGVGGFHLGMDRLNTGWDSVWFSQWEPGKTKQWAHACYVSHFGDRKDLNGEYHTCEDITNVDKNAIPDHTLLMSSNPCQDYSVSHTLSTSKGIEGKKGVLWWQTRDVLLAKKPPFCILENVDRMLKSPAKQRGRDFGIILACFAQAGYSVEWRIINAAEYGAAQRRRRVFVFAYRNDTVFAGKMSALGAEEVITKEGLMARAFPSIGNTGITSVTLSEDIAEVSDHFAFPFDKAGILRGHTVYTTWVAEVEEEPVPLKDVLEKNVSDQYDIPAEKIAKWEYLKGAKKIPRVSKDGHGYVYSEGPVAFPDPLDRPGRTMLTSESTLNRSSHVIKDPASGHLRTLTPMEAERLQGFADDWTKDTVIGPMPERMRYFCMGNALVTTMISRMGAVLDEILKDE